MELTSFQTLLGHWVRIFEAATSPEGDCEFVFPDRELRVDPLFPRGDMNIKADDRKTVVFDSHNQPVPAFISIKRGRIPISEIKAIVAPDFQFDREALRYPFSGLFDVGFDTASDLMLSVLAAKAAFRLADWGDRMRRRAEQQGHNQD